MSDATRAPGQLDLTILQGATFRLALQLLGDDLLPVDLTQYSARAKIRTADVVIDLTPYFSIPNPATNGIVRIDIPASVADTFTGWHKGAFDIEIEHGISGEVLRVAEGAAYLSPQQTY